MKLYSIAKSRQKFLKELKRYVNDDFLVYSERLDPAWFGLELKEILLEKVRKNQAFRIYAILANQSEADYFSFLKDMNKEIRIIESVSRTRIILGYQWTMIKRSDSVFFAHWLFTALQRKAFILLFKSEDAEILAASDPLKTISDSLESDMSKNCSWPSLSFNPFCPFFPM